MQHVYTRNGEPGFCCRSLSVGVVQGIGMSTYVTGALLMGQMAHEPFTVEGYIISSGWMFFCFIIGASFTAELASFLSAEEETVLVSHVATCARAQAAQNTPRHCSSDSLARHPQKRCLPHSCTLTVYPGDGPEGSCCDSRISVIAR